MSQVQVDSERKNRVVLHVQIEHYQMKSQDHEPDTKVPVDSSLVLYLLCRKWINTFLGEINNSLNCECIVSVNIIIPFQYFKTSLKTRLSIVYLETWEDQDQAGGISKQLEINKALDDLSSYAQRKLHNIEKDTTQMFT